MHNPNREGQQLSGSVRWLLQTRRLQRAELLQMKLEDLAAPGTADITTAFNPSKATGCAYGLWLLVSREGTRILVRYESRVRIDLLMQTQLELIGAGY
jgi:hypothetical protein